MPGRARGRAGFPQRPQLRPDGEVLRRRRFDAGAGAQDADARRSRSAAPGERERAAARRAARALRLLAHPRDERRDAAGVRAGGAGRPDQHDRPHPRRVGDRQGAHRAGDSLQLAARAESRSSRSAAPRFPRRSSSRSFSATRRARSPAPSSARKDASSSPTAGRSCSTRSATSTSRRRSSCCARCRSASSSGSAGPTR